ncbi:MAG: alpha/beta hydrolase-fold protein, partial [Armatimonadaceae bacterium]
RAFRDGRREDVLVQTAMLSHYVADAHVPFHATENYDGQLTNQRGIHRRFEGTLLEKTISDTDLRPGKPIPLRDPVTETLRTLNESYSDIQAILDADRNAASPGANRYDESYWERFAPQTRPIAIRRLETGGRRLAGMIEAAWRHAGTPAMTPVPAIDDSWLPPAPEFTPRGAQPRPPLPPVDATVADSMRKSRAQVLALPSRALGRNLPVTVLLPDDYSSSGKRYPVLYLLHGASGDHTDWNSKSTVAAVTKSVPMIVVMPDAQGDSFYLDSPGYGKIQASFLDDLIPTIDERYRTIARREGRAIAGLSMGGYGAWHLALSSKDLFACAASLSGALGWGTGPMPALAKKLYPENPEGNWTKDAIRPLLEKWIRRGEYTGPALWFDCGKDDFLIDSNRQMDSYLYSKRIPVEFSEYNGAHDWRYWDEHLRDVLTFIRRHVRQPEP